MDKKRKAINDRLQRIAKSEGLSKNDTLLMLLDIYEFKDINKIMELISYNYRRGLNITQIQQLRILLSHLKTILDRIEEV